MKPGSSRPRLRAILIVGVLATCLVSPAFAHAVIVVPPGATEGDQYFEEVPNGGGSSGAVGGTGGGQVTPATQALQSLGADGKAAAAWANSSALPKAGSQSGQGSGNPAAIPSSSTEGEGGMGFFFPLLLVITALAAIAYGLRRRLNPA